MVKKVISEKRWSYVLIDVDGMWVLTLLIGGVVEIDVSIKLTDEEIAAIRDDATFVEKIVESVKKNRAAFSGREIRPPIWP